MSNYDLDNDNPLWVKGWAVYRNSPWRLDGLFPTSEEAQARHRELGDEYTVAFGSRRLASDDFIAD